MTYINNSNSLIPTMNEEENSTQNTMSISLQKYFVNVQLKTLVQEAFKAAVFSFKELFCSDGKFVFKCKFLQKITLQINVTNYIMYNSISSMYSVYLLLICHFLHFISIVLIFFFLSLSAVFFLIN